MHGNNLLQEPQLLKNVCWFCKSSVKTTLEDFHSNQIQEEAILNSPTFKKLLKNELLHFCKNTTIRGVPRIVNTTNKSSKILWISFFIFLCAGLTICLTFLIRQFIEYSVIHPPRVLQNSPSPFPSFTVCNHRPLSYNISSFFNQRNMRNPREFAIAANYVSKKYLFDRGDKGHYSLITSSFSLSGYLESIPLEYHNMLGHDYYDFVIDCLITFRNGSKHHVDLCQNIGQWKVTPHAQFINCFSYNIKAEFIEEVTTIELYLYLNEETNVSRCIDCFISNVKSQLSGALLVIHKSNSFPNINQEAINLQPGTLTEVRLKTFFNVMKTAPYGRCKPNTPSNLEMGNETYSYTEHLCKEKTIQLEINNKCHCNAIEYPVVNRNLSFCSALPIFIKFGSCETNSHDKEQEKCFEEIKTSLKRLECKSSVTVLYHNDIIDTCFLPCEYYSYESDRSISTWPTKSWQLTWLNSSRGSNVRSKKELKPYKIAAEYFKEGREDKAIEILNKQDILESKLIAVVINRPNKNLHRVEEKEVLSLTSFLSQLGGLFSIWIGLTLISIVEIIELLMRISEKVLDRCCKSRRLSLINVSTQETNDHSKKYFLNYTSVTNL